MNKKVLTFILLAAILSPCRTSFASQEEANGDISYEEGLYIMPMKTISSTKGLQENPYGDSLAGKLSQEEKNEVLADTNVKKLVTLYNKAYRLAIKCYKYGADNLDRWKEVKNLTDPVFGNVNKETWVEAYDNTINTLQDARLYFDHLGLVDEDYTEKETLDMIDIEDLKFQEIKLDE